MQAGLCNNALNRCFNLIYNDHAKPPILQSTEG